MNARRVEQVAQVKDEKARLNRLSTKPRPNNSRAGCAIPGVDRARSPRWSRIQSATIKSTSTNLSDWPISLARPNKSAQRGGIVNGFDDAYLGDYSRTARHRG